MFLIKNFLYLSPLGLFSNMLMKNIILLGDLKFLTIIFLGGVTIPKKKFLGGVCKFCIWHWCHALKYCDVFAMKIWWRYDHAIYPIYEFFSIINIYLVNFQAAVRDLKAQLKPPSMQVLSFMSFMFCPNSISVVNWA